MPKVVKTTTVDGQPISFVDEIIGSGAMKDVYMSEDRKYVVAFYKEDLDANGIDRISMIVGRYRDSIFKQAGGDYWENIYCWPTAMVLYNGQVGIVAPTYPSRFFLNTVRRITIF